MDSGVIVGDVLAGAHGKLPDKVGLHIHFSQNLF